MMRIREFAASAAGPVLALALAAPVLAQGYAAKPAPSVFTMECGSTIGPFGVNIDFLVGAGWPTTSNVSFAQPIRVAPEMISIPVRAPGDSYVLLLKGNGELGKQVSGRVYRIGVCPMSPEFKAAWARVVQTGRP